MLKLLTVCVILCCHALAAGLDDESDKRIEEYGLYLAKKRVVIIHENAKAILANGVSENPDDYSAQSLMQEGGIDLSCSPMANGLGVAQFDTSQYSVFEKNIVERWNEVCATVVQKTIDVAKSNAVNGDRINQYYSFLFYANHEHMPCAIEGYGEVDAITEFKEVMRTNGLTNISGPDYKSLFVYYFLKRLAECGLKKSLENPVAFFREYTTPKDRAKPDSKEYFSSFAKSSACFYANVIFRNAAFNQQLAVQKAKQ